MENHEKNNKNKLKTFYLDENNFKKSEKSEKNEINVLIEQIKKEEQKCLICIFAPILIVIEKEVVEELIKFINNFKDNKNIKFELLSVYLSYNAFNQLNETLASSGLEINYITVYFGDDLLKFKTLLENGGFINNKSSTSSKYHFLNRDNLIETFNFKNKS